MLQPCVAAMSLLQGWVITVALWTHHVYIIHGDCKVADKINIKTLTHEIKMHTYSYVFVGLHALHWSVVVAVSNMSTCSSITGSGMLSKSSSEMMRWQVEQHRVPSHATICSITYQEMAITILAGHGVHYIGITLLQYTGWRQGQMLL